MEVREQREQQEQGHHARNHNWAIAAPNGSAKTQLFVVQRFFFHGVGYPSDLGPKRIWGS